MAASPYRQPLLQESKVIIRAEFVDIGKSHRAFQEVAKSFAGEPILKSIAKVVFHDESGQASGVGRTW